MQTNVILSVIKSIQNPHHIIFFKHWALRKSLSVPNSIETCKTAAFHIEDVQNLPLQTHIRGTIEHP